MSDGQDKSGQGGTRTRRQGRSHARTSEHGWWPYLLPYLGFVLSAELAARLGESAAAFMLFFKPAVPALLIAYFYRQGAYPELRGFSWSPGGVSADLAVGIALTGVWVAPFLVFASLRPEDTSGFATGVFGAGNEGLALAVRMVGFAIVTPIFEELFIRSFVMRVAEVFHPLDRSQDPWSGDFRDVPIAMFTWRSFLATVVIFTIGHVPWEWCVAIPWVVLTNLWFYYRKHVMAVVLVHAATNASLLLFVVYATGRLSGPDGQPLSLWFFV